MFLLSRRSAVFALFVILAFATSTLLANITGHDVASALVICFKMNDIMQWNTCSMRKWLQNTKGRQGQHFVLSVVNKKCLLKNKAGTTFEVDSIEYLTIPDYKQHGEEAYVVREADMKAYSRLRVVAKGHEIDCDGNLVQGGQSVSQDWELTKSGDATATNHPKFAARNTVTPPLVVESPPPPPKAAVPTSPPKASPPAKKISQTTTTVDGGDVSTDGPTVNPNDLKKITSATAVEAFSECFGISFFDLDVLQFPARSLYDSFANREVAKYASYGAMGQYKPKGVQFMLSGTGTTLKCYLQVNGSLFTRKDDKINETMTKLPVMPHRDDFDLVAEYSAVNGGGKVFLDFKLHRNKNLGEITNVRVESQAENTPPPNGASTVGNTPQKADNPPPAPPPPRRPVVESPTPSPPKASPPAETMPQTTTVGGGDESADGPTVNPNDLTKVTGHDVENVLKLCVGMPYIPDASVWPYASMRIKFIAESTRRKAKQCGEIGNNIGYRLNGTPQMGKKLRSVDFRKTPSGEELKCYLVIVDAQGSTDLFTFKQNIFTTTADVQILNLEEARDMTLVKLAATYSQVNGGDEVVLKYELNSRGAARYSGIDRHTGAKKTL
eukprot:GHVS01071955.1.p1 GENE.GHVS01071955.1~~GHVS01071955.1.p1  ORF type:complete len:611 (-),score=71.97 GHVS01071955.1:284-2116(-)